MRFGKFERKERLGAGGMGEVWKAWDTELNRWVALKFIKTADEQDLARFQREARTTAALQHPNIVAIYEVGEQDQQPFIAMEFVEGRTLAGWQIEPRRAAGWIRDAALGLQAAHDAGVIHRDLKPANLMVDKAGRVRVMDFGLARQAASGSTMTASGMMVGTPSYMSPEQARGEIHSLDARADVYGLGATLYEMLTGQPPFDGVDVIAIVMQLMNEEPARPGRLVPGVPDDLETIVLKCLEKERDRRYQSMRELASDLGHFLKGEPIAARPASTIRRVLRAVGRRKWLAAAAVAVIAVSVIALGLRARLGAAAGRADQAQSELLEQMRTTAATCLEAALEMRRAGNLAAMEQHAAKLREIYDQVRTSRRAEPHYLMGRMLRGQMKYAEALAAQNVALAIDPSYASARYERALLRARRLRERLVEVERLDWQRLGAIVARSQGDVELPMPAIADLLAQYPDFKKLYDELQEDLAFVEKSGEGLERDDIDVARGIAAWARGEPKNARALLEKTTSDEGVAVLATIDEHEDRGEDAVRRLAEGVRRDAGFLPLREQYGMALVREGVRRGPGGRELLERALAEFETMLKQAPASLEGLIGRAEALASLALVAQERNDGGWRTFSGRALADWDRVLAADPGRINAWIGRGSHRANRAYWEDDRGGDPRPEYTAAIEDLKRSTEPRAVSRRGICHMNIAAYQRAHGLDDAEERRLARAELEEAVRLYPRLDEGWMALGVLNLNQGRTVAAQNGDPSEALETAARNFLNAIRAAPRYGDYYRLRAIAYATAIDFARARGAAWREYHEQAVKDLAEALRLKPADVMALEVRMELMSELMVHQLESRQDGSAARASVEADAAASLKINPSRAETLYLRGSMRMRWVYHAGGSDAAMGDAIQDLEQAASLQPKVGVRWQELGVARSRQAERIGARGEDPSEAYRAAVADFDKAVALRPAARLPRGHTLLSWGTAVMNRGGDPRELFAAAREDLDEAVRSTPKSDEAWLRRGMVFYHLGVLGVDAKENYARADRDYAESIVLNPRRAESHLMRAIARANLGFERLTAGEAALDDFLAAETMLGTALELVWSAMAQRFRGAVRINISQAGGDGLRALTGAVDDLKAVLAKDAKDAEAWLYLGHAHMNLGSLQNKAENYRLALKAYEECGKLSAAMKAQCVAQGEVIKKWLAENP